jgi:proteic killer suppression protein
VIRTFADQATSDVYHDINSKAARRLPQRVWPAAQRKMSALNAATSTQDLSLPGMAFESLKYDRPGYNSIRVNDQYRIIFQFVNGDAYDVGIEDFHGRKST